MASFVDTSLFALNIATGLSLGLAVDYALLLVSRYREEIACERCDRGRRTAAPFSPPAAPPSSPAHRRRGAGRADLHAAALPLLDGGRRRLGRGPLLADRDPRRALAAGAARAAHRRALDPPRTGRLRHLRRLVPPRPRRHAPPARRRAGKRRADARRGGAAAVDDADRPQRRSGAARASPRRRPTTTSKRTTRATSPRRSRSPSTAAPAPAQLAAFRRRVEAVGGSPAAPRSARASGRVAFANFALGEPALHGRLAGRRATRSATSLPPAAATVLVSGNTAGFIDQKQSLLDHAPLVVGDHRPDHPGPALPAHRLGAAAAQDAGDELADPRRRRSASSSSPSRRAGSTARSATPGRRRSR